MAGHACSIRGARLARCHPPTLEFTIAPAGVGESDYEREVKLAIAGVDDPHHKLDDYDSIALCEPRC